MSGHNPYSVQRLEWIHAPSGPDEPSAPNHRGLVSEISSDNLKPRAGKPRHFHLVTVPGLEAEHLRTCQEFEQAWKLRAAFSRTSLTPLYLRTSPEYVSSYIPASPSQKG